MSGGNASRISYFLKKETVCPACDTQFFREDILTGRGRLIAGDLTDELRRLYEPSQKYGEVAPLICPVVVCPGCYYAALPQDFESIPSPSVEKINDDTDERIRSVQSVFPDLDYREPRQLPEGAASYYLAARCYDAFPKESSPAIKQGISAIRTAWLCSDLHRKAPEENYDYMSLLFYRKARFFYQQSIEYEQSGEEAIANAGHLGPDVDNNYGFDGVLYLSAYLEYHHGAKSNDDQRIGHLKRVKPIVARLFGMGKASKQKPSAILDKSRELHTTIREELERFDADDDDDEANVEESGAE